MASPRIHGIGVLGLGIMGRRMVAALRDHPRFRIVAAFDPTRPSGADVPLVGSPEEVTNHREVDCVYIAAPPAHHAAGVALALKSGKAILCEKPLAPTAAQAEAMRDDVIAAGRPGAVNFYLAAAAGATRMRHLVASGALGELREANLTLRFRAWPRPWQAGAGAWLTSSTEGGFTREVGSHFLFQAHRLFGPGRCAESVVRRGAQGAETAIKARIDYAGVSLRIDGAVAGEVDDFNRLEIVGSKGSLALVDWDELEYRGPITLPAVPEMPDQLAAMLDGKPHQLATFAEGAAVTALTETLLA
jgi:predicted dehydrogenase